MSLKHHPDHSPGKEAAEKFQAVSAVRTGLVGGMLGGTVGDGVGGTVGGAVDAPERKDPGPHACAGPVSPSPRLPRLPVSPVSPSSPSSRRCVPACCTSVLARFSPAQSKPPFLRPPPRPRPHGINTINAAGLRCAEPGSSQAALRSNARRRRGSAGDEAYVGPATDRRDGRRAGSIQVQGMAVQAL